MFYFLFLFWRSIYSHQFNCCHRPIGLRPPQFNHPYLPAIVQSLFHITLFQYRVLAYRPTAEIWGSSKCYWEGSGEPIPSLRRPISRDANESNENNDTDNNVFKPLSDSVRSLAELQKLFAFLGHSRRQYVNVSQFAQSLDTKSGKSGNWDMQDLSIDGKALLFFMTIYRCVFECLCTYL